MNLLLCVKCPSLERLFYYGGHICHIKYKLLTSNTKILTSNTNYSHQIHKLLKSNTNYSHQIQNPDIKNKIKRSAVGEQKLCPVFTRPCPDRHFVPTRGIVVGIFCSKCGRNVDNCNFCSNCGKGKLKL